MIFNQTKQIFKQHTAVLGLLMVGGLWLSSCSSDDNDVYPDASDEIRVSLRQGISTRAVGDYRNWNSTTDPTTMGVMAFTEGSLGSYIYNNVSFAAPDGGTGAWTTTSEKAKWSTYSDATSFDFFAYMPHSANASLSNAGSVYTLSIRKVPGAVTSKPYLIATLPVHYTSAYGHTAPVPMQMDQVMTRFDFQFKLGEAMSNLRTYRITSVKMADVPATATVNQPYTFSSSWTKGDMTLTDISHSKMEVELTSSPGIAIGYNNEPSNYKTFPGSVYMLPFNLSENAPKIIVSYDVYDEDGLKVDEREREIVLNATNFGALGTIQSAHYNTVKIQIVPNMLHILSDADQTTAGYLVVG